jgi:hypothetical protein
MKRFFLALVLIAGCLPTGPIEVCDDGVENDNDTLVDCEDPSCDADPACLEELCDNGSDDNNDGRIDCDDPKCNLADNCRELSCDDAVDNDNDGAFDCADSDCDSTTPCVEQVNCDDNRDNDLDALEDCEDPDCAADPVCIAAEICNNGLDDNDNGDIDCDEASCANASNCLPEANCNNNLDDDQDGQVDCADNDCTNNAACVGVPEVCFDNGIDNDLDGDADCNDSDCALDPLCGFFTETNCNNNVDDDTDGLIDCADPNCANNVACNNNPQVNVTCPPEIFTSPTALVNLTATATVFNGTINAAQTSWSLTTKPAGSTSAMSATTQTGNQFKASLTPDLGGDYLATFTARLTTGETDTCSTTVHSNNTNLILEITWNTSAADVDIHLLHPTAPAWYDPTLDCDFQNCTGAGGAPWPGAGTADDPRLTIDDVGGFGPEQILIDQPELNTSNGYRFGAYMFTDHGDLFTDLTAKIFCGGTLVSTFTHQDLTGAATNAVPNELWKIADIRFTNATTCSVTAVDQVIQMGGDGALR